MTTEGATLAMVTCGPQLEVALVRPAQPVPSVIRLAGGSPRSLLLLAAVDLLAEDTGIERSTIGRVAVTRGPGSFTGIRTGLASAAGFQAGIGASLFVYDSLTVQATRCPAGHDVWTAQPGRRGEVYARRYRTAARQPPTAIGEIEILQLARVPERGPWVAADALNLPGAERVVTACSAAEALLALVELGVESQPFEALYVEGPPIHRKSVDG
jgi:tRNA threonylcarbamoyl adenosine modification protein YeaZ